jgi:hypothetical protein
LQYVPHVNGWNILPTLFYTYIWLEVAQFVQTQKPNRL